MKTRLHKLATTTPALRAKFQKSRESDAALAEENNVHRATVRKWRKRDFTEDLSSKRHNLRSSLSELEERMIVGLRTHEMLPVDAIVQVMRRCFGKKFSRSGVYRCLKRNGVNRLPQEALEKRRAQEFEEVKAPGFLHVDVKYLTRLQGKRAYVYVAIDRASRYVFVKVYYDRKPATAAAFLEEALADFRFPVRVVLTDNGFEFTDRCAGKRKRKATGKHLFDVLCAARGIQHRLTKPWHPWTNGLVERFNRRLAEALALKTKIAANSGRNCFACHAERNAFITNFAYNYNHTRLRCLGYKAPLEILHNLAEQYTCAGMTEMFAREWQMVASPHLAVAARTPPGSFATPPRRY